MSETCPLIHALAEVQAQFETIPRTKTVKVKTKDGREYSFKYADLDDIMAHVRPKLAAVGLSVTHEAEPMQGTGWVLVTRLRHPDTDRVVEGRTPILWAAKDDPKAFGAGQTYARRYGLCALLGIVSDDDDDGALAGRDPEAGRKSAEERDVARKSANAAPEKPAPEKGVPEDGTPGAGLYRAITGAMQVGFDVAGFMATQAKEHGLLNRRPGPWRSLRGRDAGTGGRYVGGPREGPHRRSRK